MPKMSFAGRFEASLEKTKKRPFRGSQVGQTKPKERNPSSSSMPQARLPHFVRAPEENRVLLPQKHSLPEENAYLPLFLAQAAAAPRKRAPHKKPRCIAEDKANTAFLVARLLIRINKETPPQKMKTRKNQSIDKAKSTL